MTTREHKLYTKLFVTNIPGDITKEYFVQLIQPYAKNGRIVEIKFFKRVVSESCYAFLHFESYIDGENCMNDLNRRILNGHTMRVGPASKRNPLLSTTNLYIEGVPKEWTDSDLRKHFGEFGEIAAARILVDKASNASREVGFVHFTNHENALSAMETWQDNKATPAAERPFKIKFANKGRKKESNNSECDLDHASHESIGRIGPSQYPQSEMNTPRFDEPCRYFQRGNCKRGKNCFYRHNVLNHNAVAAAATASAPPQAQTQPLPPPPSYDALCSSIYPQSAYYQHYYHQYPQAQQPHAYYPIYPHYPHYPQAQLMPPTTQNTQNIQNIQNITNIQSVKEKTNRVATKKNQNENEETITAPNINAATATQQMMSSSYGASRHQTNATANARWDPYKTHNPLYGGGAYYAPLPS